MDKMVIMTDLDFSRFASKTMNLLYDVLIIVASLLPLSQAVICLHGEYCLTDADCEANASCEVLRN
jgi:hypothetical protein